MDSIPTDCLCSLCLHDGNKQHKGTSMSTRITVNLWDGSTTTIEPSEVSEAMADKWTKYIVVSHAGEPARVFSPGQKDECNVFIDKCIVEDYWAGQARKDRDADQLAKRELAYNRDIEQMETEQVNPVKPTQVIHESLIADNYDAKGSANHYKDIIPGYEYMDIMEHILGYEGVVAHLKGQIYKYLMRMGRKDSTLQEATKISWYSERLRSTIELYAQGKFPRVQP